MQIIIVHYQAFDKPHHHVFYNKTFAEINQTLTDICNTYVPTQIVTGTGEFQPLNTLTNIETEKQSL